MLKLLTLVLAVFSAAEVHAANVIFQNDLDRKEAGSLVKIDQIKTAAAVAAAPVYVRSGERKQLSKKSVLSFRAWRMYGQSQARVYLVECAPEAGEAITIKLLDVHSNRMPGDCTTTKTGFWSTEAGLVWKD